MSQQKLFLIAGEPSGDALGASLIKAIHETYPGQYEINGIGGELMEEQGLKSLLPMEELCVMGIWEVLMHLPRLYKLILGVVEEIEKYDPDAVITIDLPDFNFFVGGYLKRRKKTNARIVHYVAPTVWAWRSGRAKMVSKFLDGIMCLFPFEPPYFTPHGLRAEYVGHPFVESFPADASGARFRERFDIADETLLIGLLPGSRLSEIKSMGPTLKEAVLYLLEQFPDMELVLSTLPKIEYDVRQMFGDLPCPVHIVTDQDVKWDALRACNSAMAISGTVGLELAYAGVPHLITYKMHPATWLIIKNVVKVKHAHLGNILLDEDMVPEYLQGHCKGVEIFKGMLKLIKSEDLRREQVNKMTRLQGKLREGIVATPSHKALEFIREVIAQAPAETQAIETPGPETTSAGEPAEEKTASNS